MDNLTPEPGTQLEVEGDYYREILSRIQYRPHWHKLLVLDGNRWCFQWEWDDTCNVTGQPMVSRTAKYYLSPHMTQTEVVNRVFLAAVKGEEHETRELFLYKPDAQDDWRAPYNTHTDIDKLYAISTVLDVRK